MQGSCYCKAVKFSISSEKPLLSLYCHCSDCRKAHAAPMYQTFIIPVNELTINEGEDQIKKYQFKPAWAKEQCCSRSFCARCGARLFSEMIVSKENASILPEGQFRGMYPGNIDGEIPETFKPTLHLFCKEAIFDVSKLDDGLQKYFTHPGGPES